MGKFVLKSICLIFLLYGCVNKDEQNKPTQIPKTFRSFEISYTNGWTRGFSFVIDSNRIFLSPIKTDTIVYGLLPDSIFTVINSINHQIQTDSVIKFKNDGCVDCPVLAIQTISGNDTTNIYQLGKIDAILWELIKALETFNEKSHNQKIYANISLETRKIILPPPLPPIRRKFLPPKQSAKTAAE